MSIEIKHTVTAEQAGQDAASLLSQLSQLPKQRIKDAMTKGAVVLKRKHGKRLRRATEKLQSGDLITLHYDEQILATKPPEGCYCLHQSKTYSVWFKPAGLMSQGTAFGDHLALLRLVELQLNKPVYLVHRLDRETSGLMLIAHTGPTAAKLSRLFEQHEIRKTYEASVLGETLAAASIETPLDGKTAITHYQRLSYDPISQQSRILVQLETGRLHQIRRHLAAVGHPVIGDPRYGQGNKNKEGLQLVATELAFRCPDTQKRVVFSR